MMQIIDGIAYADTGSVPIRIRSVRAFPDYHLGLKLDNEIEIRFDFRPLLAEPCYHKLRDPQLFNQVYLDVGAPTWEDGRIDIAPEYVIKNGISV